MYIKLDDVFNVRGDGELRDKTHTRDTLVSLMKESFKKLIDSVRILLVWCYKLMI